MSLKIKIIRKIDKYFLGSICLLIGILSFIFQKKELKEPKKIVFVKLWAIGDSVLTLPLIKQIKEKFPKSKISIIVSKRNADVYKYYKPIEEIIILEPKKIIQIFTLFKKYNLVFDLEPYLNSSALLSWFIGKYTIGFSKQLRSILYNKKKPFSKNKHINDIYLDMGSDLIGRIKTNKLEKLKTNEQEKKKVEMFLKKNKVNKKNIKIGLCIGAAESVRERMWPEERFIELVKRLYKKYNAEIIFTGSPKEFKTIKNIQGRINNKTINSAGKLSLRESFYLIEQCDVYISNDTGPMHIAAAQGCKTIGLFGPNTPKRWGPYGKDNISIYHKQWCSPCIINEKGVMPKCINKEFQKCMKEIKVEEVEKAVKRII